MDVRRIVTTNQPDGTSEFASDMLAPRCAMFDTVPGFEACLIWADSNEDLAHDQTMSASWTPPPGGSRLMKVTFPPDSAPQGHNIDPAKIAQEYLAKLPGLAEAFEVDHPGMHRTQTLDYAVVLDGEIWLELDNGNVRALKTGDVVVQTGTRHAWRNKGTRPVTMLFVLIGSS